MCQKKNPYGIPAKNFTETSHIPRVYLPLMGPIEKFQNATSHNSVLTCWVWTRSIFRYFHPKYSHNSVAFNSAPPPMGQIALKNYGIFFSTRPTSGIIENKPKLRCAAAFGSKSHRNPVREFTKNSRTKRILCLSPSSSTLMFRNSIFRSNAFICWISPKSVVRPRNNNLEIS